MKRARELATIENVTQRVLGGTLSGSEALGATVLEVDDIADFDEEGGYLVVEGNQYTYTSIDLEASTVTLSTGLLEAAETSDRIDIVDATGRKATERYAHVRVDGATEGDDLMVCRIVKALAPYVELGPRAVREWCVLRHSGENWEVTDLLGRDPEPDTTIISGGGAAAGVMTFTYPGMLSVEAGKARFRVPFAHTLLSAYANVNGAPTGASVIVDINRNGSTIFPTQANRPTITAGTFEAAGTIGSAAGAAGDYYTVDVDQIGSTYPGDWLTVTLEFEEG